MVERLSRDNMLLGVAVIIGQRGTCSRLSVGAVASIDGRIIATGYNGAPSGLPHCDHRCTCQGEVSVARPHHTLCPGRLTSCENAEHAERNAIAFAARHGLALKGSEMHVTHAPCLQCARSIINAGIQRVTYINPYRLTDGVDLLVQAGIQVVDWHKKKA